jgi:Domain of unknown function (DUF4440)
MSKIKADIIDLEERLRVAELGPDPAFFEEALAEEAILVSQDGQAFGKKRIVQAHQPGKGPKFTRVEMTDMRIIDHGTAAVVTCKGTYKGLQWSGTLDFMRVWLSKNGRWQIIAGAISN